MTVDEEIESLSNRLKQSQDAFLSGKNKERILSSEEHFKTWDEMWELICEKKNRMVLH